MKAKRDWRTVQWRRKLEDALYAKGLPGLVVNGNWIMPPKDPAFWCRVKQPMPGFNQKIHLDDTPFRMAPFYLFFPGLIRFRTRVGTDGKMPPCPKCGQGNHVVRGEFGESIREVFDLPSDGLLLLVHPALQLQWLRFAVRPHTSCMPEAHGR